LRTKDFLRYAREVSDIEIENECPVCRKMIQDKDIIWIEGGAEHGLCTHTLCGTIFRFLREFNVYKAIGYPFPEGTISP